VTPPRLITSADAAAATTAEQREIHSTMGATIDPPDDWPKANTAQADALFDFPRVKSERESECAPLRAR